MATKTGSGTTIASRAKAAASSSSKKSKSGGGGTSYTQGQTFTDTMGNQGVVKYDGNTGKLLQQGGSFNIPTTSTDLKAENMGTQPVNLPNVPVSINPGNMAAANAGLANQGLTYDAKTGQLVQPPQALVDPQTKTDEDYFNRLMGNTPPNAEAIAQSSGLPQIEQARREVQNYTGQINTIVAKAQADTLAVTGQGRGIPEVIIGGQQAQINKEAAIQALPIQALLANAQGNLELAQQHFDTVFKLRMQDATAQYEYRNNIYKAVYDIATKSEQRRLDALEKKNDQNFSLLKDAKNFAQELSTMALRNNDAASAAKFAQLSLPSDTGSPTFETDLNEYTTGISKIQATMKPDALREGQLALQQSNLLTDKAQRASIYSNLETDKLQRAKLLRELNPSPASEGADSDLSAYASDYASSGKLPSPAELKLSGLSIGQVTSMAKQMPKQTGSLVSTNTGVKSSSVSATQEDGIVALYDLTKKLDELSSLYTNRNVLFPSKANLQYNNLKSEFTDLLSRARTGAAITPFEQAEYLKKLPSVALGQINFYPQTKIKDMKSSLEGKLKTTLNAQQLSVYGYSKVNVGGTNRTVGEVIDVGGTKYKVLPDGTLTDII